MRIRIELTGKTPLVMHNERLSDPGDEFTKQIKELTDKGTNQTDVDKALIGKLEWHGGLYREGDALIIPSANILRCLRETAAITRDGRNIVRAVIPTKLHFPLIHNGPTSIDKLYADPKFTLRRPVKVGRGKVIRVRPQFPTWGISAEFELLEDIFDLSALRRVVDFAGTSTGLCDGRIIGYGRFEGKVAAEKPNLKAA